MRIKFKTAMIVLLLLFSLGPVSILGYLTYQNSKQILLNEISGTILKTMDNAKDYFIDSYIGEVENALYLLSKDISLKEVLTNPTVIEKPLQLWDAYREMEANIWYIYMGTEDANIYVSPEWIPPERYDPRVRPWYQAALKCPGRIVWSEPYLEYISHKIVVTVSTTIENEEGLVGVLAIDTASDRLSDIINSIKFGDEGYAILIDQEGNVIAHKDSSFLGKTIKNDPWFESVRKDAAGIFTTRMTGKDTFVAYTTVSETGWKLVSFIPNSSLETEIKPIWDRTANILVFTFLFSIFICMLISDWFSARIQNLLFLMEEVENENFRARYDERVTVNEFIMIRDKFNKMVSTIENLINERNRAESQLKYMSLHDALTDTYNRHYFETALRRIEEQQLESVGIIVCDIDGLKLINDTLGHHVGDQMLIEAVKIIKQCIPPNAVLSRIGGDEFAVIVYDATEDSLKNIAGEIRNLSETVTVADNKITLSISIGYDMRKESFRSIDEVFKQADNNMYKEKLHQSQSNRSAIVKTLMQALEERDYITEGHVDRVQNLIEVLAEKVGLDAKVISELRLFAQFHDIGKVGIPDRILFKPGKLTSEEMNEMKRHSEIGYRIALSSPDFHHIADWILKHHEWWNGEGYPIGLKNEEIPLACRILSIVDAYDAMTSDRPYRKAMSHDEAVDELKRESGIKFDPDLLEKFLELIAYK